MIQMNNVFNALSTTINPKSSTQPKKTVDLKSVYNNISEVNKRAPLYKLKLPKSRQNYLIGIKEGAMSLKDIASSFSDTTNSIYQKKKLSTDNNNALSVSTTKDNLNKIPFPLTIDINKMATPQTNIGNFVSSNYKGLLYGTYSFSISTIDDTYDFNVNVASTDKNLDVQQNIAYAINSKNIGIDVSILSENKSSALSLTSKETGTATTESGLLFSITDNDSGRTAVDYFGMIKNITPSDNAYFTINDQPNTSVSNSISINKALDIDFLQQGLGPVNISLTPDVSQVIDKVDDFIDTYNSLIKFARNNQEDNIGSNILLNDISSLTRNNRHTLESAGLIIDESGFLQKDEETLTQAVNNGEFTKLFSDISSFNKQVTAATNKITFNPIAYVNKVVLTYPNTTTIHSNPYTKSLYSGLIYNDYV